MNEETCVNCGLPIVLMEPRGIWRTANPKTRSPYYCRAEDDGNHAPEEIVLWQS